MKNVKIPDILHTLEILHFFNLIFFSLGNAKILFIHTNYA